MKMHIEVQIEGREKPELFEIEALTGDHIRKAVLEKCGFDEAYIFQHDNDVDIGDELVGKKAVVLVAHRCKKIAVTVRYEHRQETKKFAPSATVYRVLQWAIGKKGFKLDPTAAAKANLIIPGAKLPLPREDVIGKYSDTKSCGLILDLTLQDFSNG